MEGGVGDCHWVTLSKSLLSGPPFIMFEVGASLASVYTGRDFQTLTEETGSTGQAAVAGLRAHRRTMTQTHLARHH